MARSRRGNSDGRHVDWSGINESISLSSVANLQHVNLWQPVVELERATVTRIRGCINMDIIPVGSVASFQCKVSVGIQVVNRAQGTSGVARDPALVDDLEGGEWLYLRQHTARWRETGIVDGFEITGGDILTGGLVTDVDVKAQRIIDLSQDELLVSFSLQAAAGVIVGVDTHMRLLLKYG